MFIVNDTAFQLRIPANHPEMVKFEDSGREDYKQLEELIMKMIPNSFTSHTPTAKPTEEAQYHAGNYISSPQVSKSGNYLC